MKKVHEGNVTIGGNYNARTGANGDRIKGGLEEEGKKASQDKEINKNGIKLLKLVEEAGWMMLNGNIEEDEDGEYAYVGSKSNTVIDYIILGEYTRENITRLIVEYKIDSDHRSLVVEIKNKEEQKDRVTKDERKLKKKRVSNGELIKRFNEELNLIEIEEDKCEERVRSIEKAVEKIVSIDAQKEKKVKIGGNRRTGEIEKDRYVRGKKK